MTITFGIIGLLIISFAIWLKNERKQDILFILGGISLLIYSITINNLIFIILQIVFITSASIELFKMRKNISKSER